MKPLLVGAVIALGVSLAAAHCPFNDCLKACRVCKSEDLENAGAPTADGSSPFLTGEKVAGDCKQLVCKNEDDKLVVANHAYDNLVCFQGKWNLKVDEHVEEVTAARCVSPPVCVDADASPVWNEDKVDFECVCNAGFTDVSDRFERDPGTICSKCPTSNINLMYLLDSSGSTLDWLDAGKTFVSVFSKFFDFAIDGTKSQATITLGANTWENKLEWGQCTDSTCVDTALATCAHSNGASEVGYAMEGVKATLIQPDHVGKTNKHILFVLTDGAFENDHCHRQVKDAAEKFSHCNITTLSIGYSNTWAANLLAVAAGITANVYANADTAALDALPFTLQKTLCA